jgi:hypothetical protein
VAYSVINYAVPATNYYAITGSGTAISCPNIQQGSIIYDNAYPGNCEAVQKDGDMLVVPKGRKLKLPDGSVLHVDDLGNYRLDDSNAKVIHQANRMREFNPYVNASDLLASFIRYLGSVGLNRGDAGMIPVVLFINWLVIEAAMQDGDPIPADIVPPEQHPLFQKQRLQLTA